MGKVKNLVALVYRFKTNCKQYAFESIEDLEDWGSRKPYADEDVLVIAVKDRMAVKEKKLNAKEAAEFVKTTLK